MELLSQNCKVLNFCQKRIAGNEKSGGIKEVELVADQRDFVSRIFPYKIQKKYLIYR